MHDGSHGVRDRSCRQGFAPAVAAQPRPLGHGVPQAAPRPRRHGGAAGLSGHRHCFACWRRSMPATSPAPIRSAPTSSGKIELDGQQIPIMEASTEGLGLGFTPIGPTWNPTAYMLGADSQGRDVAARLLYGGRNSLLIAGVATLICLLLRLARRPRPPASSAGGRLGPVPPARRALGFSGLSAGDLAVDRADRHGIDIGPITINAGSLALPIVIIGIVYVPYVARPIRGQVLSLKRERVRARRRRPRRARPSHPVARYPAQCRRPALIVFVPADDGAQHADGVGTVLPLDRRAAARCELGHDHPGRPGPALYPALGGAGAGHRHRAHRAGAQRARRRRARRARSRAPSCGSAT